MIARVRAARGTPLEFRAKKWLWIGLTFLCLGLYAFARPFWNGVSIIYVTFASNYAMVATYASAEQASEAKEAAQP
jgi:hypothetical protein